MTNIIYDENKDSKIVIQIKSKFLDVTYYFGINKIMIFKEYIFILL
jgi:hypothetical protein